MPSKILTNTLLKQGGGGVPDMNAVKSLMFNKAIQPIFLQIPCLCSVNFVFSLVKKGTPQIDKIQNIIGVLEDSEPNTPPGTLPKRAALFCCGLQKKMQFQFLKKSQKNDA